MIERLSQLAKINSLINESKLTRFNSILPMKIDVIDELIGSKYKLLIGNRVLETKSNLKLDVGSSYWGVMKEDIKKGSISLSKLLKFPHLLKNTKEIPKFDIEQIRNIFSKENPKSELKMVFLQHLANSSSRNEFLTLTNMLHALEANVFTFVMTTNNKDAIFQFKKRKKKQKTALSSQESEKIDFYAGFENLGPIEGVIEVVKDIKTLSLYLYYESSLEFLKRELKNLDIEAKLYKRNKSIEPIYTVAPAILDIKG